MANDPEPTKMLLSRRQVAELAGVSVKTVIRWEKRGWLTPTLPGGRPRYARSDVEHVLGGVIEIPQPPSRSSADLLELARQLDAASALARRLAEESEAPVPTPRPRLKAKKQKPHGET